MYRDTQEVERPGRLLLIDLEAALERMGGDEELLCEAAQLFLDCCDESFTAVVDAVDESDFDSLTRAAHALKGAVRNFGAREAEDAALRLEMIGRNHEAADMRQPLLALRKAVDRLRPVMGRLAQAHSDGVPVRAVDQVDCDDARQ